MVKLSNYLILSVVLFVVFPSQLSMYDTHWAPLTGLGILLFTFFGLLIIISRKIPTNIPTITLYLFLGLILSSLFSYYFVGEIKPLVVYGALIVLFIITRTLSEKIKDLDQLIISMVFGACLSLPIITILGANEPFLGEYKPFSFFRFRGFFTNANSMGMFTAGIIHMTVGVLYGYKNDLSNSKKLFFYFTLLISFIYLLASNSRSAILSVIVIFVLLLFILFLKSFKISKLKLDLRQLKIFFSLLFFIILFSLIIFWSGLIDNSVEKFFIKRARVVTDISDGRLDGWLFALENWNWFGYRNFAEFADLNNMKSHGHSTWISHLNDYGLLATSFFLMWIFLIIVWTLINITRNKGIKSNFVLFCVVVGFFVNASFQSATSTPGLLISVIMFAILYKRNHFLNNENSR